MSWLLIDAARRYARPLEDCKWYKFNDAHVTAVDEETVMLESRGGQVGSHFNFPVWSFWLAAEAVDSACSVQVNKNASASFLVYLRADELKGAIGNKDYAQRIEA